MMLICGLMLLLLQTAACLERNCSFIESDQICYAALGHKLSLLMVLDESKYDLKIQKRMNKTQDDPVCRVKNGRMKECDLFNNRPEATVINGTVIINPVIRTDSGNYTVTLSDISGSETSRSDLQVIVEAPIGSVNVSLLCSSNGVMRASCSSDGDQLLYSWTLNGQTPMDGNSSIELNERTDGNLTCKVKNHISDGQKTVTVKYCSGSTTASVATSLTSSVTSSTKSSNLTFFSQEGTNRTHTQASGDFLSLTLIQYALIALGCVALILILLFITVCHIYRKKQLKSTTVPAGEMELDYAEISHEKRSKRRKSEPSPSADVEYAPVNTEKKKKEEEVQYGEVTFVPNRAKPQTHSQPSVDECLYSEVNRR